MGVSGQHHAPAAFTPVKDPVPITQEAGWASEPVRISAENLAPTGIRSTDLPARSESLYRLSNPGSIFYQYLPIKSRFGLTQTTVLGTSCEELSTFVLRAVLNIFYLGNSCISVATLSSFTSLTDIFRSTAAQRERVVEFLWQQ